jgi:hypothetical protein
VRSIWDAGFTQTQAQTAGLVVPSHAPAPPFIFHTLRTRDEVECEIAMTLKRRDRAPRRTRWSEEGKASYVAATWSAYDAQVQRYQQELAIFQRSYRDRSTPPPQAERAFVASYYGSSDVLIDMEEAVRTCTQVDRHGLVVAPEVTGGTPPAIEDCSYRMLKSKEVKRAMGIPEAYEIVATSQREETRQCDMWSKLVKGYRRRLPSCKEQRRLGRGSVGKTPFLSELINRGTASRCASRGVYQSLCSDAKRRP